jgi:5-methylcytosine-specific restriction protein A
MSPTRAKRSCAHPGCPALVDKGRCPKHRKQDQRQRDTKTAEERRFYGSQAWKDARLTHRRQHPLCATCLEEGRGPVVGTTVDHIIPRRDRPDLELDPSNFQTQCNRCHARKRRQERPDGAAGG